MFIPILRFVVTSYINLTCKMTVDNLEYFSNVEGKVIVTANHLGRIDALMIYYLTAHRDDLIIIAAEKYGEVAFFRWLARKLDAMFVDRYNADFGTVRKMLRRLKKGGVMVIAPEGTRSQTKSLQEGRNGAAYIAMKSGVPIVPVSITGSEDEYYKSQLKRFRRAVVHVRLGKPYTLPPMPKKNREEAIQAGTDEIMCRIGALLPENYRGMYSEFPRLKELIEIS